MAGGSMNPTVKQPDIPAPWEGPVTKKQADAFERAVALSAVTRRASPSSYQIRDEPLIGPVGAFLLGTMMGD